MSQTIKKCQTLGQFFESLYVPHWWTHWTWSVSFHPTWLWYLFLPASHGSWTDPVHTKRVSNGWTTNTFIAKGGSMSNPSVMSGCLFWSSTMTDECIIPTVQKHFLGMKQWFFAIQDMMLIWCFLRSSPRKGISSSLTKSIHDRMKVSKVKNEDMILFKHNNMVEMKKALKATWDRAVTGVFIFIHSSCKYFTILICHIWKVRLYQCATLCHTQHYYNIYILCHIHLH